LIDCLKVGEATYRRIFTWIQFHSRKIMPQRWVMNYISKKYSFVFAMFPRTFGQSSLVPAHIYFMHGFAVTQTWGRLGTIYIHSFACTHICEHMRMADTFSPRRQLHIEQDNEIAHSPHPNALNSAPKSMPLNVKLQGN